MLDMLYRSRFRGLCAQRGDERQLYFPPVLPHLRMLPSRACISTAFAQLGEVTARHGGTFVTEKRNPYWATNESEDYDHL
jgi:hypothetical protein